MGELRLGGGLACTAERPSRDAPEKCTVAVYMRSSSADVVHQVQLLARRQLDARPCRAGAEHWPQQLRHNVRHATVPVADEADVGVERGENADRFEDERAPCRLSGLALGLLPRLLAPPGDDERGGK